MLEEISAKVKNEEVPFRFGIKKENVTVVPQGKPKGYFPCPKCGKRGYRTTDKGDKKLCAYCNYSEGGSLQSLTFNDVSRYVEACRVALLKGDAGALRIIADNVEREIRGEVSVNNFSANAKLSGWELRVKRMAEDGRNFP